MFQGAFAGVIQVPKSLPLPKELDFSGMAQSRQKQKVVASPVLRLGLWASWNFFLSYHQCPSNCSSFGASAPLPPLPLGQHAGWFPFRGGSAVGAISGSDSNAQLHAAIAAQNGADGERKGPLWHLPYFHASPKAILLLREQFQSH